MTKGCQRLTISLFYLPHPSAEKPEFHAVDIGLFHFLLEFLSRYFIVVESENLQVLLFPADFNHHIVTQRLFAHHAIGRKVFRTATH